MAHNKVGHYVDNDAVDVGAKVVDEQCKTRDDKTVEQRLLLAGGTTMQESSKKMGDNTGSGMRYCVCGSREGDGVSDIWMDIWEER